MAQHPGEPPESGRIDGVTPDRHAQPSTGRLQAHRNAKRQAGNTRLTAGADWLPATVAQIQAQRMRPQIQRPDTFPAPSRRPNGQQDGRNGQQGPGIASCDGCCEEQQDDAGPKKEQTAGQTRRRKRHRPAQGHGVS